MRRLLLDLDPCGGNDPLGMFPFFIKRTADVMAPRLSVVFRRLVRLGSSRAITGPPKMSLLLEVESTSALIIEPRLILVPHTNDLGGYITSNQQGKMLVQYLHRIVRRPNVSPEQIPNCTTDCIPINLVFQENFPTNTQVRNSLCPCMHTVGKADEQEPNVSKSGECDGMKNGAVIVSSVLVKSGCVMCIGGKSDRVAVASVLVGTEVQWQWQLCWWERKFSGSGKCVGGNASSVAVASVLVGTEGQWQVNLCFQTFFCKVKCHLLSVMLFPMRNS